MLTKPVDSDIFGTVIYITFSEGLICALIYTLTHTVVTTLQM